ncbi:hypothetical protein [Nitratifractor sp.]
MKALLLTLYILALPALLFLARRLGYDFRRIALYLLPPVLLYASVLLATDRITEIDWSLSQLPFAFLLFCFLFLEALLFLSPPLLIVALSVETLRLHRQVRTLGLVFSAVIFTALTLSLLQLPLSYLVVPEKPKKIHKPSIKWLL